MSRIENIYTKVAGLMLVGGLAVGCCSEASRGKGKETQSIQTTPTVTLPQNVDYQNYPVEFEKTFVPTQVKELVVDSEKEKLSNPWKGHVFNQRCKVSVGEKGYVYDCVEEWAEKPFPGGCPEAAIAYLGSSSCNAAATSFVLNELVSPEKFMEVIGKPGITPDVLIEDVYTNLPGIDQKFMTCSGAGASTIKAALKYFGLQYRDAKFSDYSLPDVVRNLKPNERLIISIFGYKAKNGKFFQHFTVASGVGMFNGRETVYYHDSYYFKDPKNPNYDTVMFEESRDIRNDPSKRSGKDYVFAGGIIVSY